MTEEPQAATAALPAPVPAVPAPAAPAPAVMARRDARGTRRGRPAGLAQGTAVMWRRWLGFSAAAGVVAGVLWWLIAPGGAFHGDGTDYDTWFARDAVLAILLAAGGILSAVLAMGGRRRTRLGGSAQSPLLVAVLAVAGTAGAVIAWRTGVFAGDLFHKPPANMANPSMVFSLRSGSVLLLWPLASSAVVFAWTFISYFFVPAAPRPEKPATPEAPGAEPAQDAPATAGGTP